MTILHAPDHHAESRTTEELLIKEARRRTRRRRGISALAIFAVAAGTLLVTSGGRGHGSPSATSPASASSRGATPAAPPCQAPRIHLLSVISEAGGLGHAGVLVRLAVSSSSTCSISGYPTVQGILNGHSTAIASNVRDAYLPGGIHSRSAPLPKIAVTSHPRAVSFTLQWADIGGGATCPLLDSIAVTLPGSRHAVTATSMREGGVGVVPNLGSDCGHLAATPLVKGGTGRTYPLY